MMTKMELDDQLREFAELLVKNCEAAERAGIVRKAAAA
jgi:hypothetical protein